MSNWEKFKKQESQNGDKPEGKKFPGNFTCEFCQEWVLEGRYYPNDSVVSFKCSQDHLNIIENFKVMGV